MMKSSSHKLLLLTCLSILWLRTDLVFAGAVGDKSTEALSNVLTEAPRSLGPLSFENVPADMSFRWKTQAETLWKNWSQEFSVAPATEPLTVSSVERVDSASGKRISARSTSDFIEIDSLTSSSQVDSIFAHELAHVFLLRACPNVFPSHFESELFAVWMSRDFRRIVNQSSSDFPYASVARAFLTERSGNDRFMLEDQKAVSALSRLLAEAERSKETTQALNRALSQRLASCTWKRKEALALVAAPLEGHKAAEASFLLLDGISGEVLESSGEIVAKTPAASLLKAVLLSTSPSFKTARRSRGSSEWSCPDVKAGVMWKWDRALAHSCNGFFLDSKEWPKNERASFLTLLRQFGFSVEVDESLGLTTAIGLINGINGSMIDVARLFSYIGRKNSDIVEALKNTAKVGTLSHYADSPYFVKNGIALKSGTIRDAEGRPHEGWIVAIGPQVSGENQPSYIAVIRQTGASPPLLLPLLRSKLENVRKADIARVQILGLVPKEMIRFECDGFWLDEPAKDKFIEGHQTRVGQRLECSSGKIIAKFPLSNGTLKERLYFGSISRIARDSIGDKSSTVEVTPKQVRARSGADFVLETSDLHYLVGSLASEHSTGRDETLKALALVMKANLRSPRHGERPICDTTHCQVFGVGSENISPALKSLLIKTVRSIDAKKLVASQDWFHFSKGGGEPWESTLDAADLKKRLKLEQDVYSLERNGKVIRMRLGSKGTGIARTIGCEKFRSALKLLSCPDQMTRHENSWNLSGIGEGHGEGLDLEAADQMASEGRDHEQILKRFFPSARVVSTH